MTLCQVTNSFFVQNTHLKPNLILISIKIVSVILYKLMFKFVPFVDCKYDLFAGDPDGKRVTLSVYLGCHGSYHRYIEDSSECVIASVSVSGKTKWEMLDALIRRAFKVG